MDLQNWIDRLNKDLSNEYAHWHFYKLASVIVQGLHRAELSEFFREKAAEESGHIEQFSKLILGLGGIPVSMPSEFRTDLVKPKELLEHALELELGVVSNFVETIDIIEENISVDRVNGKYIIIFLEDQILDSKGDADELKEMLKGSKRKK